MEGSSSHGLKGDGGEGEDETKKEEEELLAKAQKLMDNITSSPDNPNSSVLHALSSLFEFQESAYLVESGHSSNYGRVSHNIGRLGNLVRENDDFFELTSSKFLSESSYSTSVQAAAARLVLSCSLTWIYPHIFEEPVVENVKNWVFNETAPFSGEDRFLKHDLSKSEASDSEMLKTYATGLLAVLLAGGGQVVEDVLTCGLSAKFMRYLRMRVLGEMGQKDASHLAESKNTTRATSLKGREEGRGRVRQVLGHPDDQRTADERSLYDLDIERVTHGEEYGLGDGEPPDGLAAGVDISETNTDGHEGKTKFGDNDESGRDDPSRQRANSGWAISRGKGKVNVRAVETDQGLTSPVSGSHSVQTRSIRDRSVSKNLDTKKAPDRTKHLGKIRSDDLFVERDCFQDCKVGSKDIFDLVKKAVSSAEAEAREANASIEAIKAVCDAAAEVVKSAALEEFKTTNDEEAAFLAASRAASTVINASNAIAVSRNFISTNVDLVSLSDTEKEANEDVEEYFIPDVESLAQLREKYCIQCLEILGEYTKVLGPVLHEKGVDVCLALLQLSSKSEEVSKVAMLLPDVMKLICALAAHRKFAALFVDRGGMQKLLAVPRKNQTFFGLSSFLFTVGSSQGIMERVCALPSDVVHQLVELAIQLLECTQNQARRNATLFFTAAFIFRAVIDAFDARDGLQKLLGLLNDAASVRSGVNSGAVGLSGSTSLQSPPEVLTLSEKQVAYLTCVALRQYFRAHLLLLVDSIRSSKSNRSAARNIPNMRAAYKPLDISYEAIDAVFLQLQKDCKLGPAFVRTHWPAVDRFLSLNGHIIMLELCQAPPGERYLHDLLQFALDVLHIVTLVPNSRKMIVNATLSNNHTGVAVILDVANVASSYVDLEIIQPALNVLINLVCPPPSISTKPPLLAQSQQSVSGQTSKGPSMETRDRNAERNFLDRAVYVPSQSDIRERNRDSSMLDRGSGTNTQPTNKPVTTPTSGLVRDRRISLGAGAGCAGLAAQLEQGYCQAREAVRANNGIKVLLHLLQPRIYSPPAALDCLRALACRVLLGLARDDSIAHILTKLQVRKKLSKLIRDTVGQTPATDQGRWQAELSQVAIELIAIVTNSRRASALAATDAATPTLRCFERAAIAAATPISYHSRELLLLIHEHLQASGLAATAAQPLKEGQLTPLPAFSAPTSIACQASMQENPSIQLQWPSGRTPGFLTGKSKLATRDEDICLKCDSSVSSKKKQLVFSPNFSLQSRHQPQSHDSQSPSIRKVFSSSKQSVLPSVLEIPPKSMSKSNVCTESQCKTPIVLPLKQKSSDLKDTGLSLSGKQLYTGDHGIRSSVCPTPNSTCKSSLPNDTLGVSTPCPNLRDTLGVSTPCPNLRDQHGRSIPSSLAEYLDDNQCGNYHVSQATPSSQLGVLNDPQPSNSERLPLDSLVVQYLKHQHHQCPAPITTLPPLSLLRPHVCPEPKQSIDAPSNVTARLGTREFRSMYSGVNRNRRDRQLIYSRFRPWRTCRDDAGALLTCITFIDDSSHIAVGNHTKELKIFYSNSNNVLESWTSHQGPVMLVQSHLSGETQLLLSSSSQDVCVWNASSIAGGPMHSFEGCKAARFSNSGNIFAALPTETSDRGILLYDIQTNQLEAKLSDTVVNFTGRGHASSQVHFSLSDTMLLWNGVLWDLRNSVPVHRFDQFTDYGGGGFHPAGNEVIINSEVWDLRKFMLLRSVPSLDQTTITFNGHGDVIYAILRRNLEDMMSAVHPRPVKHPLSAAFRTVDAINYSDIATIPVGRCVLDFATEPTDSFVGLITMDDQEEMFSSARIYEIGRRRPTDDDSDPDDPESAEEDEEDDYNNADVDPILGADLDGDGDDLSNTDEDEDGDFNFMMDGGGGLLEIVTEGDEDEDNQHTSIY